MFEFRISEFKSDFFADVLEVYMRSYEGMEEYGEITRSGAKRYIKWLAKNSDFFVVAFYGSKIVGFVAGSSGWTFLGKIFGEIHEICVLPEFRGMGIGTKFIEFAIDYFRSLGLGRVGLWVGEGNQTAIRFYKRLGFHEVGEKFSVWIRMEKDI